MAAWDDSNGLHLGVRDANDLAADVLQRLDQDRVPYLEPAFVEHEQPGDHVQEEALRGEGQEDDDERRSCDRPDLVRAKQYAKGQESGESVGE